MDRYKLASYIRKVQNSYMAICVGYVIFGIFLLFRPDIFNSLFSFVIGMTCVIYCGVVLVQYVSIPYNQGAIGVELIFPVLVGLFGFTVLIWPGILISILPSVIGIMLIASGLIKLSNSLTLKNTGFQKWWAVALMGIVSIVLGIIMIFNPFDSGIVMLRMTGVFFIIDGACGVFSALVMKGKSSMFF